MCVQTTTAPVTTFAPPTTTAAPPTTTIAPDLTSTPYDVSMQMSISPFPGIAGGQSVVSGNATSNTDVPPTGTVEFTVRTALPTHALWRNVWGVPCIGMA